MRQLRLALRPHSLHIPGQLCSLVRPPGGVLSRQLICVVFATGEGWVVALCRVHSSLTLLIPESAPETLFVRPVWRPLQALDSCTAYGGNCAPLQSAHPCRGAPSSPILHVESVLHVVFGRVCCLGAAIQPVFVWVKIPVDWSCPVCCLSVDFDAHEICGCLCAMHWTFRTLFVCVLALPWT